MEKLAVTDAVVSVIKNIKAPNILVIGKTGVGKSSLINAVFGQELAKTGAGFPITQSFNYYSNGFVNIYDSAGYEFSGVKKFWLENFEFLESKQKSGLEEQIHIIWYLINAASGRIDEFDIDTISGIRKYGIPLIVILSQVDRARDEEIDSIKSVLKNLPNLDVLDIIDVAAAPLEIRGKPICEPFGLEEVVEKTIERLPEIYADAVRMAQIVDLKSKRELSWKLITAAAALTFGSAWLPIAGATTGASLGVQEYLAVSIASVYGFGQAREFLPQIYRGKISKSTLSVTGVTLGFDILSKFIPVAGSMIAGGTAATLIVITGMAYVSAFESVAQLHIDSNDLKALNRFLDDSFQEAFAKYSKLVIRSTKDLAKVKDRFLNQ